MYHARLLVRKDPKMFARTGWRGFGSYCACGPGTTEAPPIALLCAFTLYSALILDCPYCTADLILDQLHCAALLRFTLLIGLCIWHWTIYALSFYTALPLLYFRFYTGLSMHWAFTLHSAYWTADLTLDYLCTALLHFMYCPYCSADLTLRLVGLHCRFDTTALFLHCTIMHCTFDNICCTNWIKLWHGTMLHIAQLHCTKHTFPQAQRIVATAQLAYILLRHCTIAVALHQCVCCSSSLDTNRCPNPLLTSCYPLLTLC